jgi:uncharacterized protein with PIN domain
MSKRCENCNEEIEENELGKLIGTVFKAKIAGENKKIYFCRDCQKDKDISDFKKGLESE